MRTTSATEAKEAAILEAISSALAVGDDIGEVDVEVTVIELEQRKRCLSYDLNIKRC